MANFRAAKEPAVELKPQGARHPKESRQAHGHRPECAPSWGYYGTDCPVGIRDARLSDLKDDQDCGDEQITASMPSSWRTVSARRRTPATWDNRVDRAQRNAYLDDKRRDSRDKNCAWTDGR